MMLHISLHSVDAGQGHTDQRRARYAPMNPGAFCHPLRRGRVGIVSPREPSLAALTTARRLISGCGRETLSRLSGFLLFSYEISLRISWAKCFQDEHAERPFKTVYELGCPVLSRSTSPLQ